MMFVCMSTIWRDTGLYRDTRRRTTCQRHSTDLLATGGVTLRSVGNALWVEEGGGGCRREGNAVGVAPSIL